jgi:DNA-binding LytR/AlgR family response regulator
VAFFVYIREHGCKPVCRFAQFGLVSSFNEFAGRGDVHSKGLASAGHGYGCIGLQEPGNLFAKFSDSHLNCGHTILHVYTPAYTSWRDIEIVGEYADGIAALEAINRERPDLMFLDVQMPGVSGLQVIDAAGARVPTTIFVTAHKDYAISAFEANAVDYILKAFGRERVERSVARAKARLPGSTNAGYASHLIEALSALQKQQQYQEQIAVPVNGRILLVAIKEIDWIEASRNSVRLHVGTLVYELRHTLSSLEARLNPK